MRRAWTRTRRPSGWTTSSPGSAARSAVASRRSRPPRPSRRPPGAYERVGSPLGAVDAAAPPFPWPGTILRRRIAGDGDQGGSHVRKAHLVLGGGPREAGECDPDDPRDGGPDVETVRGVHRLPRPVRRGQPTGQGSHSLGQRGDGGSGRAGARGTSPPAREWSRPDRRIGRSLRGTSRGTGGGSRLAGRTR